MNSSPIVLLAACVLIRSAVAGGTVKVTARIDATKPGPAIPKAFMGFSHEWSRLPAPDGGPAAQVHPAYVRLLEQLSAFNDGALSIRIGGNSADGMGSVPEDDRWRQYGEVFKATRTPLIINLNLARKNVALDRDMIRTAQRLMPPGSIEVFELGNEPDGWKGRYRPADYSFESYLGEFGEVAKELVPALTSGLAGPAWAHAAPPEILQQFLAAHRPMIKMITVHSYRFDPKSEPKIERLLDDRETAGYAAKLVPGIEVAHEAGLKIRLTEAGSAWGGGIAGFSDSFAAALWTLDVFFELAKVGLDGVNLHGGGMSHYSPIHDQLDTATGKTTITASAPFFGMRVFAEATANEARFLPVELSSGSKVKVWAMLDRKGVTRLVIINKDSGTTGDLTIHLPGAKAAVKRLSAPSPGATEGMTFAGQTWDHSADGDPIGAVQEENIPISGGVLQMQIAPTTAALVTVSP